MMPYMKGFSQDSGRLFLWWINYSKSLCCLFASRQCNQMSALLSVDKHSQVIPYSSSRNSIPFPISLSCINVILFYFTLYPSVCGTFQKHSFHSVSHCNNCLISCYSSLSAWFSQGIQCLGNRRQNGLETALIELGTSFIDDFGLRISSKQGCLLMHSSEKSPHILSPVFPVCTLIPPTPPYQKILASLLSLPMPLHSWPLVFKPSWCQIANFWALVQEVEVQIILVG